MKFRWLTTALLVFALCVSAIGWAQALDIPVRPDGYITDRAGLLSSSVRTQLTQALGEFERETSTQIVVATFPSLENESLEDFSIRLSEKWKVGKKGKDNGVVLLIFRDDRKMRIEVGYGLEGVLPDALAGQIIREAIVPRFRENDYEGGVMAGVQAIAQATQGEYTGAGDSRAARRALTPEEQAAMAAQFEMIMRLALFLVLVLAVADFFRYTRYRKGHVASPHRYRFWEWWFRFAILFFIFNIVFRMIFYSMLFSRGGMHGSRGGFGGFSGGGGGFGGGGASGSW